MKNFRQAFIAMLLMPVFISCATYRQRIDDYYQQLQQGNYEQASNLLDKNSLLNASRNKLLYLLEKGYTLHLTKQFDSSNLYFNAADKMIEAGNNAVKDIAIGTVLNPMMQQYKSEDYERFMVHYYKALNYIYLNKTEEALVEARRITLAEKAIADQHSVTTKKYNNDAFALILQGIIYEKGNDINNAFISYRNAANIFLEKDNLTYYGVSIPLQLKKDVLRTAYIMGFRSDLEYYERRFNLKFEKSFISKEPELILFAEVGMAPVKQETNTFFTLIEDNGAFFFTDYLRQHRIPIDYSVGINQSDISLKKINTFRVALPSYIQKPRNYKSIVLKDSINSLMMEKAEDINELANSLLKERMLKEVSLALSRLLLKKLAEKEVKKKDKEWGEVFEALNFFTEKADTRNWQSLPSDVFYARIPVSMGKNNLQLEMNGNMGKTHRLNIDIKQPLTILNFRDMN